MHDQYGIGLIVRGAQKSLSGRGTVEAGASDLITCNPGEVHEGTPIGGEARLWSMLYFDPEPLSRAVKDITGNRDSFEFELPAMTDRRMALRFSALFKTMIEPERGCAEERLLALLASLIRPTPSVAASSESISTAKQRIDDDPAGSAGLLGLADEAGISGFQLLRGFRQTTGLTPHAYRIQRRLQLARRMIAKGAPLADVAAASGFADQSHMTRLFARSYGLTPGSYARAVL